MLLDERTRRGRRVLCLCLRQKQDGRPGETLIFLMIILVMVSSCIALLNMRLDNIAVSVSIGRNKKSISNKLRKLKKKNSDFIKIKTDLVL